MGWGSPWGWGSSMSISGYGYPGYGGFGFGYNPYSFVGFGGFYQVPPTSTPGPTITAVPLPTPTLSPMGTPGPIPAPPSPLITEPLLQSTFGYYNPAIPNPYTIPQPWFNYTCNAAYSMGLVPFGFGLTGAGLGSLFGGTHCDAFGSQMGGFGVIPFMGCGITDPMTGICYRSAP
jgi:hypothetical protein